jgi:adenylate cyclase
MEIERRFLIEEGAVDFKGEGGETVFQGYLASSPEGTQVRVRRKGHQCFLTVKHGPGLQRVEVELPLEEADFQALWELTQGRRLQKTRYELPLEGGLIVELDVFEENLAGLRIAEVEFASEEDARAFQPPPYFGREVTDEPAYRNSTLAEHGLPKPVGAFDLGAG